MHFIFLLKVSRGHSCLDTSDEFLSPTDKAHTPYVGTPKLPGLNPVYLAGVLHPFLPGRMPFFGANASSKSQSKCCLLCEASSDPPLWRPGTSCSLLI